MQETNPIDIMVSVPKSEVFDPASEEASMKVMELMGDLADSCKRVGECALNMGVGTEDDGTVFIGTHCEPSEGDNPFKGCTVYEIGEESIREQIVAVTTN